MGSSLVGCVANGIIESAGNHDVQVKHPHQAESWIRFKGAAKGWNASAMDKLQPEQVPPLGEISTIGLDVKPEEPIFENALPEVGH